MLLHTALVCVLSSFVFVPVSTLSVGRGISDVTGAASEGALYGYAKPNQDARGIHMRTYSRAFVFDDGVRRAAFVVVEVTMISQAVHKKVLDKLAELYGGRYTAHNVMMSPTHSHSAPGGYHTYWMYQAPSEGFINETFNVLVDGIVSSIQKADADVRQANVFINAGDLLDASENRSPYAYYNNPPGELDQYPYDVDKTMTVIKVEDMAGMDMGLISLFAVHTTSMKSYNHLVSSDNKGYAAQMMERYLNPASRPGQASIIAAFTQTSEGDSSPNTDGSRCENEQNDFCYYNTSTCPEAPNDPRLCTGRGPAGEHFEDTRIIGEKQYLKARELFESASEVLNGIVDYRFQWVNMSDVLVTDQDGQTVQTCRPAMGYSFAAGATDGPGVPPFTQAMLEPLDNIEDIIGRVYNMSEEMIACHAPKPILFPSGELVNPWIWQPEVVPLQLLRIGHLVLIGVPAEVCTMAGRRLQNAVKKVLVDSGLPATVLPIVIAMTNSYASYLVTYEEYLMQRYEGASTIFGPHTLQAYTMKFERLARAMATGGSVIEGNPPPDLMGYPDDALAPIRFDQSGGPAFGTVLVDPELNYNTGDTVSVTFLAANPRNDLMTGRTFLEVQRHLGGLNWEVAYSDADWETRFYWQSACHDDNVNPDCTPRTQQSNATITWDIPTNQQPGRYRIAHFGNAKWPDTTVRPYLGVTVGFEVAAVKK